MTRPVSPYPCRDLILAPEDLSSQIHFPCSPRPDSWGCSSRSHQSQELGPCTSPSQGPVPTVPRGWQTGPRLASKVTNPEKVTTPILEPAGKVWQVSKGALQCWGLPRLLGSPGHRSAAPSSTDSCFWPALHREARSLSSAEATWTRRGGKRGKTVRGGAHRAIGTESRGEETTEGPGEKRDSPRERPGEGESARTQGNREKTDR